MLEIETLPCGCNQFTNVPCGMHKELGVSWVSQENIRRFDKQKAMQLTGSQKPMGFDPQVGVVGIPAAVFTHEPKPKNIGIGGAPTRATTLPNEAAARKTFPVASGFMDYFPDAIAAVSHVSWKGNEQHNPGQPLHWARGKSTDESDTMLRHFLQRGTLDTDGQRHSAKMVWRALAILQKEIEGEG